jgi:flavin-dependent dehydrogenase
LFIGDAARVVEPFTGEGIYYALRSGELAANAVTKIGRGGKAESALREFSRAHAEMYRGRLWINRLARTAVLWPRVGSVFVRAAQIQPAMLRLLTRKIVSHGNDEIRMTNDELMSKRMTKRCGILHSHAIHEQIAWFQIFTRSPNVL